jgi:epoxyqueuosine reductase QueG
MEDAGMMKTVIDFFARFGIELIAPIPLSQCRILRQYKLKNCGFEDISKLTAIMIAIPYYTECRERNLSSYAVSRDYHLCFDELFGAILPILREKYPQNIFAAFADNPPIDEREAAAMAGLGIIGDNMMLITEKYSSYVFLGEIITDLPIPAALAQPIRRCESCGACLRACPKEKNGECLSSLTQKKGELNEEERLLLKRHPLVWGCDACLLACPHANQVEKTPIPFFKTDKLYCLTQEMLEAMDGETFASRAYSWRKRETILRNLSLHEN